MIRFIGISVDQPASIRAVNNDLYIVRGRPSLSTNQRKKVTIKTHFQCLTSELSVLKYPKFPVEFPRPHMGELRIRIYELAPSASSF